MTDERCSRSRLTDKMMVRGLDEVVKPQALRAGEGGGRGVESGSLMWPGVRASGPYSRGLRRAARRN